MDSTILEKVKSFIESTLGLVNDQLDNEAVEAVCHYIDHDEYEMAFEGLFLEIMKLKVVPKIDFDSSMEYAISLNLNTESVFDDQFWRKFQNFIELR